MTTINNLGASSRKGRPSHLGEIKLMLFSLAIAGTLGLWELFSHQAQVATVASATTSGVTVPGLSLEFPPLPELIAPGASEPPALPGSSTGALQAPEGSQGRTFMGGSAPGLLAPQPVTRTRSSR